MGDTGEILHATQTFSWSLSISVIEGSELLWSDSLDGMGREDEKQWNTQNYSNIGQTGKTRTYTDQSQLTPGNPWLVRSWPCRPILLKHECGWCEMCRWNVGYMNVDYGSLSLRWSWGSVLLTSSQCGWSTGHTETSQAADCTSWRDRSELGLQ